MRLLKGIRKEGCVRMGQLHSSNDSAIPQKAEGPLVSCWFAIVKRKGIRTDGFKEVLTVEFPEMEKNSLSF